MAGSLFGLTLLQVTVLAVGVGAFAASFVEHPAATAYRWSALVFLPGYLLAAGRTLTDQLVAAFLLVFICLLAIRIGGPDVQVKAATDGGEDCAA